MQSSPKSPVVDIASIYQVLHLIIFDSRTIGKSFGSGQRCAVSITLTQVVDKGQEARAEDLLLRPMKHQSGMIVITSVHKAKKFRPCLMEL